MRTVTDLREAQVIFNIFFKEVCTYLIHLRTFSQNGSSERRTKNTYLEGQILCHLESSALQNGLFSDGQKEPTFLLQFIFKYLKNISHSAW